jgi:hypothetical protein
LPVCEGNQRVASRDFNIDILVLVSTATTHPIKITISFLTVQLAPKLIHFLNTMEDQKQGSLMEAARAPHMTAT